MLLHIDGKIVEIRPGEFFNSKKLVESRFLELLAPKTKPNKRNGSDKNRS